MRKDGTLINANGGDLEFHHAVGEYLDLSALRDDATSPIRPDKWPLYFRALLLHCNADDIPFYYYHDATQDAL